MPLKNIPLLILFIGCSLFGQQPSAQINSLLEVQASFGPVQLIHSGVRGNLFPNLPELFNEDIEKLNYKGRQFDIGFLASRSFHPSWSVRSGLQYYDLQSKIDYQSSLSFVNPAGEEVQNISRKITTNLRGLQIPVLLSYQQPVGKWTAFAELGFSLSYAPVKIKRDSKETYHYSYGIAYADSCSCNYLTNVLKLPSPFEQQFENDDKQYQYEARGLFGLGVLIPQKEGRALRLSYQLSSSLHPLSKGTREYNGLYEPYNNSDSKYRHLAHQLSAAWAWPSKKELITEDAGTRVTWKGAFVGTGISLLNPMQKGAAWGRHVEAMYLTKWGFGARMEVARLVAPSSFYGIEARFNKVQLLYHLGYGIQVHAGGSWGTGNDGDGSIYKGTGAHLGGSVLFPLSRFMGLHLQATGHHFFTEFGSPNMLEGGLGLVFRVWR
jgi:Outer membrane protein beta-barrel domain